MKKFLAMLLILVLVLAPLAACTSEPPVDPPDDPTDTEDPAPTPEPPEDDEVPFIAVISKGFQHQFWQTVYAGARDAAAQYGVDITFEGPPTESDIHIQVDMVNAALARRPAAIALASLCTESLDRQLTQARDAGIPVIGFDSGVPDAPAGSIFSTAATDNYGAGALAADEMFAEPSFAERLNAATADAPIAIAIQSQDATSASILDRTNGFINRMFELASGVHPGAVEVSGHTVFNRDAEETPAVQILVTIPPTTSAVDSHAASQAILQNTPNLIGMFLSNEASVGGVLAATNDGTDLDRETGIFSDLIVVGFDSGSLQKHAVRSQFFYGSVTQDPYMIGFLAVQLAVRAINGEPLEEFVDTGAKFWTHANMDDPAIYQLLYD